MLAVPTSSLLFALNKHSFKKDSVSGNSSLTAQTATIYITISQHLYSTHYMPGIVLSAILITLRKHAYTHTHTLIQNSEYCHCFTDEETEHTGD